MLSFTGIFVICCLFALSAADEATAKGPTHGKKVLCRIDINDFVEQEKYINKFDFNLCTHPVIYTDGLEPNDLFRGESKGDQGRNLMKKLKDEYPHLKFLHGVNLERVLNEFVGEKSSKQKRYIKDITKAAQSDHFDGYDMVVPDLQKLVKHVPYPEEIISFLKQAKESFEKANLTAVVSFSATKDFLSNGFPFVDLIEYVDLINYMPEYNVDNIVDENIPKYFTVDYAMETFDISYQEKMIDLLKELGIPKTKLIMGFHLGGPRFLSKFSKDLNYDRICDPKYQDPKKWDMTYDQNASVATITSKSRLKQTIIYLNSRSIANRMSLITKSGLAGASVDSIFGDDIKGECENYQNDTFSDFTPTKCTSEIKELPSKRENTEYPLLQTMNEAITATLSEMTCGASSHSTHFIFGLAVAMLTFFLN